ncbi:MAG: glycosyltransferase [Methylohalobius sp. ZOD2]
MSTQLDQDQPPGRPMKICLVTPSFEQGEFIERAVRSVLTQPREGFVLEYIVRDAQSSDRTPQILKRLQQEFPELTVRIQPDGGQASALEEEFAAADADILGWLNADDVLLPGALPAIAGAFRRATDVVYGEAWFIDESDRIIGRYPSCNHSESHLQTICYFSQPSVFFTRAIYNHVGGIRSDLHFALDYDLWLRFARAGARFVRLRRVLSATRLHEATKTASAGLAFADEIIAMQRETLGTVAEPWYLYRRFRELCESQPSTSAFLCYAKALLEYLPCSPKQFISLSGWSARIAGRMLVCKLLTPHSEKLKRPSNPSLRQGT